jgi:hypothetical protein
MPNREKNKGRIQMNRKKALGIACVVVGAAMVCFSGYIASQVNAGKEQIQDAQGKVDTLDSVFSMSKYTKSVGKQITGSAQKRIDAGQADVDKYEALSKNLKIGGLIVVAIGAALLFFRRAKRM